MISARAICNAPKWRLAQTDDTIELEIERLGALRTRVIARNA